jgi:hypothetical protein
MADRQVTATTKAGGQITAVAGAWGVRSRAAATIDIQNHAHTYYVLDGSTRLQVMIVKSDDGRVLRTSEDLDAPDPLNDLPDIQD